MTDLQTLHALVDQAGGIDTLSAYIEVDSAIIEVALNAPTMGRTDRVARMVEENTRKLLLMPSQRGFFWRLTRRRVVKDWLILAKQGLHAMPQLERNTSGDLSQEQRDRLDLIAKILRK